MELRDRVIVVTGGGRGIGAAMCRRFAEEGPRGIVVVDADAEAAEAVAAEVGGTAIVADVADEHQVRAFVSAATDAYGPVDLLCLNAGIATGGGVEVTDEVWQRTWEVNVMAHVYGARAVLPSMLERGEGYLLHTVSAAGLLTNIGAAPYSVTKHAVLALAEWLAVTYGDRGLRVSALCPQFVSTRMLEIFGKGSEELDRFVREVAITPEDVADAVAEGLRVERFLILPHPEVAGYFLRKAEDYDRWLAGMRRLQAKVGLTDPTAMA